MPGAEGGPADLAGGAELVLLVDGVDDIRHGNTELGDPVGPQPDTHRIVAAPRQVDLPHARDSRQAVDHIDRCIV